MVYGHSVRIAWDTVLLLGLSARICVAGGTRPLWDDYAVPLPLAVPQTCSIHVEACCGGGVEIRYAVLA